MISRLRMAHRIAIVGVMFISAVGYTSSAQAGLYVEGSTDGQFSNNDGGSISADGQTYSWGWHRASTLDINHPTGEYNFSGNATFVQTIGTLTWTNRAPELLPSARSVDASWDFSISDPVNAYTGTINGTLHILDIPWLPDAMGSFGLSSLIGTSTDIQHAGGTLTVQMLAPTVSGDGGLFGHIWLNPEGGTSTLNLQARFTNVESPVVPTPASLSLFAVGAAGLVMIRRRRRDTMSN